MSSQVGSHASSKVIEVEQLGDTNSRVAVLGNGTVEFGSGSAARDVNLYRSAANVLKTDDTFAIGTAGALLFGASGDVNLYRIDANTLGTDDGFTVFGAFTHGGSSLGVLGTAAVTKQEVTGSKGANAALTSLLAALVAYGLITDSSS